VAPETPGFHQGLAVWRDQPQYSFERLETRRGQLIAVSGGRIDSVELCVSNDSDEPESLDVRIVVVDHIWDYRAEPGEPLASGSLVVPPGKNQWISWLAALDLPALSSGSFIRIDALPNKKILWHAAQKIIPGHMAMYGISPNRMRRFGNGHTLAYRISPPQRPFTAGRVLSGVTRPHRSTNLWISDPVQPLPQWLRLTWPGPQRIRGIQLVFPGQLIREYHAYAPFYRDSQCPRDYRIEALVNETWVQLLEVRDNYQRLRRHVFDDKISTSQLRVIVTATNGDPSAALYEIRCL
jgi:hypothetical protein